VKLFRVIPTSHRRIVASSSSVKCLSRPVTAALHPPVEQSLWCERGSVVADARTLYRERGGRGMACESSGHVVMTVCVVVPVQQLPRHDAPVSQDRLPPEDEAKFGGSCKESAKCRSTRGQVGREGRDHCTAQRCDAAVSPLQVATLFRHASCRARSFSPLRGVGQARSRDVGTCELYSGGWCGCAAALRCIPVWRGSTHCAAAVTWNQPSHEREILTRSDHRNYRAARNNDRRVRTLLSLA